ncbi:MAG: hypothetical protein H6R19_1152 [Proteobacteria bacterium]|nr:hypothetical protein [Pseudomonadota bacterium]
MDSGDAAGAGERVAALHQGRIRRVLPWLVLSLGLLGTLVAWKTVSDYVRTRQENAFHAAVSDARRDIEQRMENYRQILLGFGGLIHADNAVSREQFNTYYRSLALKHRYPGVVGVGYAIVFGPEMLAEHERQMRAEGFANYRVLPPGRRERYSAVIYGEPFAEDGSPPRSLGMDMLTEATRRRAMDWARDNASTALTGKLRLFLGTDAADQISVVMYVPVYRAHAMLESLQDRRQALLGYVFAGFRLNELLEGIFGQHWDIGLDLQLYEGGQTDARQLLYDSTVRNKPDLLDDEDDPERLNITVPINLPGGKWTAAFRARSDWIGRTSSSLPALILYGGLVIDGMLFALLMLYGRSEQSIWTKAEARAAAMTSELRASEARFRTVVQASPGGMLLVDPHGRIELANAEAERMFAYEADGLLGAGIDELLPHRMRNAHQILRENYMRLPVNRVMGEGRALCGLRCDGSEFPLEIALSQVHTERGVLVLAAVTDITERHTAAMREAATRAMLQGVIDGATAFSIIACDPSGLITLFNTGAQRMLGYSAEEMVGKQSSLVLHDPAELKARGEELSQTLGVHIEGYDILVHAARAGQTETREWFFIRKDGRSVPVSLTVSAIPGPTGVPTGFIGIAYDVSAQRMAEHALAEARDHAEATSRAKTEFLSNMSHEIRTPLNAVLGMAQLLGFGKLDAEQREYLRMIEVSGKTLLGVLNDILDFSKIEAGQLEISSHPFFLQDMTDALADIMQANAVGKNLDMSIEIDPAVPVSLLGDQLRLQQILINLVGNAIKFTHQGEVRLYVHLLERREESVLVQFVVEDTGIGMSEEQIGHLFVPFSQIDNSMTRKYGGSGLGLAICKRLVEIMGGQIGVSSAPGQGSRFRFTVWLKRARTEQAALPNSLDDLRVRDLLLVESNPTLAGSITSAVKSLGIQCEQCASESEAIAHIVARGRPHDVVLIDWNMPDQGRSLLISQLHGELALQHSIVLGVSSAYGREALNADPLAVSLDGVLIKPVTSSTFLDCVMQACAKRDSSRDLRKLMQIPELQLRARSLRGARLLLVEDNAINQMVARGILQLAGAVIDVASNGQEAVDRLRRHPGLYVMVLMDVQMPVMDGCTATRIIRDELQLDLPVVAMTAGVLPSQRSECLAAGMTDFLAKPLDAQLTIDTLEAVLLGNRGAEDPVQPVLSDPQDGRAAESALMESVPGLDQELALARIGGNRALYGELLLQFRIEIAGLSNDTQNALANCQLRDAERGFHTIKSTAASIGAITLVEWAQAAESAVRTGDIPRAQALYNDIHDELERLLPGISRLLEQRKLSPAHAASGRTGVDQVALEQLLEQLRRHDLDALDVFEYLRAGLPGAFGAADAERLTLLVSGLDFDPAVALLEKLMGMRIE